MTKRIYLAILIIPALFLLSACENATQQDQTQQTTQTQQGTDQAQQVPGQPETNTANQQGALKINDEIDPEIPPIEEPHDAPLSEGDQAAYISATQLNDEKLCEKITSEELKSECKLVVVDSNIFANAIESKDESECEKLSSDDQKSQCKITVQSEILIGQEQEKKKEVIMEENVLKYSIIDEGDYTNCNQLTDQNYIEECEKTILLNRAIQENDITVCEKASNKTTQDECKRLIQLDSNL